MNRSNHFTLGRRLHSLRNEKWHVSLEWAFGVFVVEWTLEKKKQRRKFMSKTTWFKRVSSKDYSMFNSFPK